MPRSLVSVLLSLVVLQCFAVRAGNWTQFRGPAASGRSLERDLPISWSDEENVAWRVRLPGAGSSSPIVLDDRVYVTSYSGYGQQGEEGGTMEDLRLHVSAFDRDTGQDVWNTEIKPRLPESRHVRDHGYAAATPTTDGQRLYVFFGKTGVLAFDLQGKEQWRADVGTGTHGWGCGTSPVLYNDLVIVNASVESGSLVALDCQTGNEMWRAGGMRSSWNTPHLMQLADGSYELVVSVRNEILGYDPDSGDLLWRCDGIEDYVCPSIVSHEGVAFVIGGRRSRAVAVRAGGRGDVTETHRLWTAKAGANVSSPVVHAGHLYWVSDRNRVAYCVRLNDGKIIYSQRFKGQPYASCVYGDQKLYVVTRRNGTFVLAATPTYKILSHNKFTDSSQFNATPAIAGGRIFLRSDQYLYSVGG